MLNWLYIFLLDCGIIIYRFSDESSLPRKRGKGNQQKSFVVYLSRLFVTGYSKVLKGYEWRNYKNHSQWGNSLNSWKSILKQSINGFIKDGLK